MGFDADLMQADIDAFHQHRADVEKRLWEAVHSDDCAEKIHGLEDYLCHLDMVAYDRILEKHGVSPNQFYNETEDVTLYGDVVLDSIPRPVSHEASAMNGAKADDPPLQHKGLGPCPCIFGEDRDECSIKVTQTPNTPVLRQESHILRDVLYLLVMGPILLLILWAAVGLLLCYGSLILLLLGATLGALYQAFIDDPLRITVLLLLLPVWLLNLVSWVRDVERSASKR